MNDSDIKKDELLKEPSQDATLVAKVDGIVDSIEVDDELLAEIEAIQAVVEESEEPVEVVETAAGENSDGGSSSAVDFARDGSQTLASTEFKTAGFSFSTASVELTDTNNTDPLLSNPTQPLSPTQPIVDNILNAQFTDNFVSGVKYSTSSGLTGFTGESGIAGEFKYNSGDIIIFTVGDVVIGEFSANAIQGDILFLQDIAGNSLADNNSNHVENMAIFLQALDDDLTDSNETDGVLKTDNIINKDASYATNINISEAMHSAFSGYIDPTTGKPLNITNSGKEMISQALASVGIEFTRDSERDENGENVFESIAMEHVAETIQELAGDERGEVIADDRQVDTIDVPGGLINFNFQEAEGVITFTTDDLLEGAVGQQVITENLVVKNVTLSAAFENIGTLVDKGDGNYEIELNEGVTGKELENLSVDYRVEDWTVIREVTSKTLDSYKSHLSADIDDVVEDAGFNQFTLNSTLTFDEKSLLQINFTSELLSKQLTSQVAEELAALGKDAVADENGVIQISEYADDFTIPLEYSNDGGITWVAMNVVAIDTSGDIPRPIFGFELAAGNSSVEIRIPIFDDLTIEPTEYFRAEIEGEHFYDETILFAIEDNDTEISELPTIDLDFVLITEGQGDAVFTLTLSKASDEDIRVDYDTQGLSAVLGEDFEATSGTLIIKAGQTSATISIPIIDDLEVEVSPEFALLNLSNPVNAVINDAQGTLRIFDNDYPVEINVSSPQVIEGEQAIFTVDFEKDIGDNPEVITLVNLALVDGSANAEFDYDLSSLKVFYGDASNPQYLEFDGKGNVIVPAGINSLTVVVDTTNDDIHEQNETFELVVKIANEEASSNATIIDNDINKAPTIIADNGEMDEDSGSLIVNFDANDVDGNIVSTIATVPAEQGTVIVDDENGTYTFTPAENFNGEVTITLITEDNDGAKSTTTSTILVSPVNDAPVLVGDNETPLGESIAVETVEDTPVGGTLQASDPDGDTLTFTQNSDPTNGSVVVNEDGTWEYTPNENYNGDDSFTVIVEDGNGGSDTITVNIGVLPENDGPVLVGDNETPLGESIAVETAEDTPVGGTLQAIDSDGDSLTFTQNSDPTNGSVVVNEDGTWEYT
ncbi:tandem-95 repeat protein, partial [Psychromonas marina]